MLKDIEQRKVLERKERLITSRDAELRGQILHPVPGRIVSHAANIVPVSKYSIPGKKNRNFTLPKQISKAN